MTEGRVEGGDAADALIETRPAGPATAATGHRTSTLPASPSRSKGAGPASGTASRSIDVIGPGSMPAAISDRSFNLAFEIHRSDADARLTEGQSMRVWLGADRRAASIPPAFRSRLEASILEAS